MTCTPRALAQEFEAKDMKDEDKMELSSRSLKKERDMEAANILKMLYCGGRKSQSNVKDHSKQEHKEQNDHAPKNDSNPATLSHIGHIGYQRSGKWNKEEEEYAQQIVNQFRSGLLQLSEGTTLRQYLSEKLQCDPMRVTKKFCAGFGGPIGKQIFRSSTHPKVTEKEMLCAKHELMLLEYIFNKSFSCVTDDHIQILKEMHQNQWNQLLEQQSQERLVLEERFKPFTEKK
mmetsp:Transcript_14051/g.18258  ORF Transcript_14051/g.18258 Transcript_14051/m.18258 type:complete len:231 (-) Transcript_14051:121-813(-)|eukprot:CAMPEP_0114354770 /NCGR_PEP_ID=MMETSP0101-20121206/19730_1 /TAXON_ID=38822 ORGANISM="Pteridomonas danica, Strain PT" /NCGR_SAMPLE_ID=MMETSP0101 /ASSEMBLY_ACC=CAM_ASM_000211 /LENGTH=230 /DNA_ID=CAMNT_0001496407 /DNA_START=214 /DNA_END=906 /DNA_ORIENTATION=+